MGGFDPTSFMGASGITNQYIQNQQIQEYLDSLNNPTNRILAMLLQQIESR
jgi:hypothetical protein